jgi:hypothetical protein
VVELRKPLGDLLVGRVVPLRILQQGSRCEFFRLDVGAQEGLEPFADEIDSFPLQKGPRFDTEGRVQVRSERTDREPACGR